MSIVLDLQEEIYSGKISTQEALRKAYVISKKLDIHELSNWFFCELNGYGDENDIPDYRKIYGNLEFRNPYHGWQPVAIKEKEKISTFLLNQSIGELENLISGAENKKLTYSDPRIDALIEQTGRNIRVSFSPSQVHSVTEIVKNKILEWTLNLENKGILGERMRFNLEEKEKAMHITISGVSNSPIQINTQNTSQSINYTITDSDKSKIENFIKKIEEGIKPYKDLPEDLQLDIESLKLQIRKENPSKESLGEIFKSLGGYLRSIPVLFEMWNEVKILFE